MKTAFDKSESLKFLQKIFSHDNPAKFVFADHILCARFGSVLCVSCERFWKLFSWSSLEQKYRKKFISVAINF